LYAIIKVIKELVMNYVGNGRYEINLDSGETIIAGIDDLKDALNQINDFENNSVKPDYVETVPYDVVFAESARYEMLRTEIQDSGWKDLKWSDELEESFDIMFEITRNECRDYYSERYTMIEKRR
jgi:hypothetical protein